MSTKRKEQHTVELSALDRLQNWYEKNGKIFNIAVIAVLAIVLLGLAYTNYYKPKRELAAQNAIYKAQFWFENDSISKALNDPMNGFLTVADDYGSTKAGNLAKFYAGLCYYQLSDFVNAEKYLNKFNPNHDAITGGLAIATLADTQMENGKQDAALKNYKKAVDLNENKASTPFLLLKAGMAHDYAGKSKEALQFFETLKNNFPNSSEATEATKYIGKLQATS